MEDTEILIYNELMNLRKDFKDYRESIEARVSSLERFRNKIMGVMVAIGVFAKCCWDYIIEKVV